MRSASVPFFARRDRGAMPRFVVALLALSASLLLRLPAAAADTLVLDGDHVTDWVRVFDSSAWKYHDACVRPTGLMKFDLDWRWPVTQILSASLELFVEQAAPGDSILIWHVDDDGWSYGLTSPDALRQWPTWHLIGSFGFDDSTALKVDVTAHLQEELQAGDNTFSIKITDRGGYSGARIATPLVLVPRMRPRIVAEVAGPAGVTAPPDLAVSTADLHLSPARPLPGQPVSLQAWVRNLGPRTAAPAAVPVSFWDGPPGVGELIGATVLPEIPPTGGTALAAVTWNAASGVHDLYAAVDSANSVPELDESNNVAFREFEVGEPGTGADLADVVESFESAGLHHWHTDFEVPKQYPCCGPKSFYLSRSAAEAYHGENSIELFLDGTADDGTIWLERVLPVDPNSLVDVDVDFELFRYALDLAFAPVAYAGVLDPESEGDFARLAGSYEGWALNSHHQRVSSGPYDQIHVAVGMTVSWETPGTLFLDLVRVRAAYHLPGEVEPLPSRAGAAITLLQNRPNPMGALTTIAYRVAQDGLVSLRIYDTAGRLVTTLHDGQQRAGWHETHWDGASAEGSAMPAGVYFYRLDRAGASESRKLLLVR